MIQWFWEKSEKFTKYPSCSQLTTVFFFFRKFAQNYSIVQPKIKKEAEEYFFHENITRILNWLAYQKNFAFDRLLFWLELFYSRVIFCSRKIICPISLARNIKNLYWFYHQQFFFVNSDIRNILFSWFIIFCKLYERL